MIHSKRIMPMNRKSKIIIGLALLMCMSLFYATTTVYAAETSTANPHIAPPTVEAEIIGSLLRIRALAGFYAVEAVYINNRRFNHRVDSALVIDISGYIASGDTITVHAVDFAGNYSSTVLLTPPTPAQPPAPNNITPDGQGEILDHLTSGDNIEFITINTPSGSIFYLVIDHTRSSNNVFFLNPVTEWDLLTLAAVAELPVPPNVTGQSTPQTPPTIIETEPPPPITETPTPTEPPQTTPTENDGGGRMGMFIFLAIGGAGAFGVIYYLKIVKPRKEREMYGGGEEEHDGDDGFEDIDEDAVPEATDEVNPDAYDVDNDKYINEGDTQA